MMRSLTEGSLFVGRYRVCKALGRGAMGSVYEVEDDAGARFALKVMHTELAEVDARWIHRFEREARVGMRLAHPNIVKTIDAGVDEASTPWLVMDLAVGVTLTEYMDSSAPLAPARAASFTRELFSAVAAAHAESVVHRDLKPDNVIVTRAEDEPTLRVLDFGIAKQLSSQTASMTASGLGTPLWAAPEQSASDLAPDPRADVWALGLMTFYLFTAKMYWLNANRGSLAALAMELVRSPIDPASTRASELGVGNAIPRGFDEWFERAVSRDAARRFASAAEAFADLEPLLPR